MDKKKNHYLKIDNLWLNSQDSKALSSYCLYQNLIKTGIIDEKLNKTVFQDGFDMDTYYESGIKHIIKCNISDSDFKYNIIS